MADGGARSGATTTAACDTCGSRSARLLRCGRCQVAIFCDEVCQRRGWPTHRECCAACCDAARAVAVASTADSVGLVHAVRQIRGIESSTVRRRLAASLVDRLVASLGAGTSAADLACALWAGAELADSWSARTLLSAVGTAALHVTELNCGHALALGGQAARLTRAGEDSDLQALAWAGSAIAEPLTRSAFGFLEFDRLVGAPPLGIADALLHVARVAATGAKGMASADLRRLRELGAEKASLRRPLKLDWRQEAERKFVNDWIFGVMEPSVLPAEHLWERLPKLRCSLPCSMALPSVTALAAQELGGIGNGMVAVVHFLGAVGIRGAEGDMDLVWLRAALARIVGIPGLELHVALVGFHDGCGAEVVARHYDEQLEGSSGVTLTCYTGLYHEVESLPPPDLCVLGNVGFETHFPQWAPTIVGLRDRGTPVVCTGYTSVESMSHDAPATLEAAHLLALKVVKEPARTYAVRTLEDDGRCFCSRQLRPARPRGIASHGFWALFAATDEDAEVPRTKSDLAHAWRSFRFEVLRRISRDERYQGHYDAMASMSTFLDCVDAGKEQMAPSDSVRELVVRAMKQQPTTPTHASFDDVGSDAHSDSAFDSLE